MPPIDPCRTGWVPIEYRAKTPGGLRQRSRGGPRQSQARREAARCELLSPQASMDVSPVRTGEEARRSLGALVPTRSRLARPRPRPHPPGMQQATRPGWLNAKRKGGRGGEGQQPPTHSVCCCGRARRGTKHGRAGAAQGLAPRQPTRPQASGPACWREACMHAASACFASFSPSAPGSFCRRRRCAGALLEARRRRSRPIRRNAPVIGQSTLGRPGHHHCPRR